MASIFSRIIAGEVPGQFLYEDDSCVVLLDKFPAVPGQALVIPRAEVDYILDLDDATYDHIFTVAKRIGKALDAVFAAKRTCFVVEGFEVPHVHIKLYPMQDTSRSLGSVLPEGMMQEDNILAEQAARIKAALS